MVKICPECQKENVDTNNFCEYCGSNLPQIEDKKTDIKSVVENSSEVIKDNVDNIKNQVTNNVNEEKIKTVIQDNSFIEKWKHRLFYWKNKQTNEYKLSKTKLISIIVFLFFMLSACRLYFFTDYIQIHGGSIALIIPAIFIGLMFAVPAFIIGYIIHYLMNR